MENKNPYSNFTDEQIESLLRMQTVRRDLLEEKISELEVDVESATRIISLLEIEKNRRRS